MGFLCGLSEFVVWRVRTRPAAMGQFLFQLDPVSESRRVGAAQNATDQAGLHLDLKLPKKDGLLLSSAIAANTNRFLGAFLALTLPYE
jgi:hypothetical protein